MKKTFLVILSVISLLSVDAKDIKAYFSHATFNTSENKPFVETYLTVVSNTINYQLNENGKLQGSVSISLIFKKGEQVIDFKKLNLLSPEVDDTTAFIPNFIDQQRFSLPNDNYTLQIEIKDNYATNEPFSAYQPISINYISYSPTFSDIQLIEKFTKSTSESIITKSGYDLIPYVSNFYPENMDNIRFYVEIYNTNKKLNDQEPYLINYSIESYEKGTVVGNNKRFVRKQAASADAILGEFNIKELPSGNYNIIVDARNKNNEVIAKKSLFFQRSNPSLKITKETYNSMSIENSFVSYITNIDTLNEFVQSLYPIATDFERTFIRENKKSDDVEFLQKFFLSFWQERNRITPEVAWSAYQDELLIVQEKYGSPMRKGYQTDRGRVYLQYGKPNTINKQYNEPNSYPYEIWHYLNTEKRNNVKFVFYARELASNEFEILHSTAYGEIKDYKWELRLQERNNPVQNVNPYDRDEHFGTKAREYYNVPIDN